MHELFQALAQLGRVLLDLIVSQRGLLGTGLLVAVWVAWWLWAADWRKLWPTLAAGAWAPVVLLSLMVALVWSCLAPDLYDLHGLAIIPNFWWQLLAVGLVVSLALFCGWLQGVFRWPPPEVSFDPPVHSHDDHHGHGGHH